MQDNQESILKPRQVVVNDFLLKPEYLAIIEGQERYYQSAWLAEVTDEMFDVMLANGWRRSSHFFYRYNLETDILDENRLLKILSLRIVLENFNMSKSQQKIWKRNQNLRVSWHSNSPSREHHALFELHKQRFISRVPESLFDFISHTHAYQPTRGNIIDVFDGDKLIASSFVDITTNSLSSIYAMFNPNYKARSLGIFTMLVEILLAMHLKKAFYYPGFAHEESSFYDYKKRFNALESFDWQGIWKPFKRIEEPTEK